MADRGSGDRRGRSDEELDRATDTWVHHVADLEAEDAVRTFESERPLAARVRLDRVADVVSGTLALHGLQLFERRLSPRQPYEQSPISYLNAWGKWALWAADDLLKLTEFSPYSGGMEFWFLNVVPGTTSLVTVEITAGSSAEVGTGNLEVRSSSAAPRIFPISGFAHHTLDLIVHSSEPYADLVTLEPKDGVGALSFRQITYRTLS